MYVRMPIALDTQDPTILYGPEDLRPMVEGLEIERCETIPRAVQKDGTSVDALDVLLRCRRARATCWAPAWTATWAVSTRMTRWRKSPNLRGWAATPDPGHQPRKNRSPRHAGERFSYSLIGLYPNAGRSCSSW